MDLTLLVFYEIIIPLWRLDFLLARKEPVGSVCVTVFRWGPISECTNCGRVWLVDGNCRKSSSARKLNEKEPVGGCWLYRSQVGDPISKRTNITSEEGTSSTELAWQGGIANCSFG